MTAKRKGPAEAATSPDHVKFNLKGQKMKAIDSTKPSADAIEMVRTSLLLDASDAVEDLKNCLLLVMTFCDSMESEQQKNVVGFGIGTAISLVEQRLRRLIEDARDAEIVAAREAA